MQSEYNIHKQIIEFEKKCGIKILTSEYEILIIIIENGPISSGDLLKLSRASNSTFYNNLNNLAEKGMITSQTENGDRRKTIHTISEDFYKKFDVFQKELLNCIHNICMSINSTGVMALICMTL